MTAKKKGKRVNKSQAEGPGYYSYEGLDRVLHEKARLGILTALLTRSEGLLFNDLKQLCDLTDGNLSRHLQVLVDAGMVSSWKGQDGGRPQTLVRLTKTGRRHFHEYLRELERVIQDAQTQRGKVDGLDHPPDWATA
ncbi:MAG: transcriptional regulator [Planctomycetota bacterium]|jgi:DNA-binding MarR family transcriptional regulator